MDFKKEAASLVAKMTLAEKASLCSGKNFWYMKGIERLGLPSIMVTDGPHGVRKQATDAAEIGISKNVPAVCFPTASAVACSFDRELLREMGRTIAEECRQEEVAVLLGPGVNMKRSPLCGRNFEYFSEDPYLAGECAAAFIDGVQSQEVGVSIKHFAANNQEKARMVSESVMDERTFREIYLPAFETAIKQSHPWTVMCSYNRLFGESASQSRRLLTGILRDEWGFDGVVMSDWGAVVDRVKGLEAGLDLEMPHVDDENDRRILQAVEADHTLLEALDRAAVRLTELILRAGQRQPFRYDADAHRKSARRMAATSAVLLKNEGEILPGKVNQKAAVIGAFAHSPRYQGAGSSRINPLRLDNACEELEKHGLAFEYAAGYRLESDQPDAALIEEACKIAKGKEIVYLFAGLPDPYEAEGFDRANLSMPASHVELIRAVSQVNENVVVTLQGGAPMEMTWADLVPGILLMYLGGEASNGACADILLGKVNPSGKLAETWPFTEKDNPSYGNFPGYPRSVEYREGPFIGYRYYDKAKKAVRYPFGYGLSYTRFAYSKLKLSKNEMKDTDTLTVTCTVKNVGKVPGSEVVQLYLACQDSIIIRPVQELKGFEKVALQPGESKVISFELGGRAFSYYNTAISDWHVESGNYEIRIGASSQEILLTGIVHVDATTVAPLPDLRQVAPCYYDLSNGIQVPDDVFEMLLGSLLPPRKHRKGEPHTIQSSLSEIQDNPVGRSLLKTMKKELEKLAEASPDLKVMAEKMLPDMPMRFLAMMSNGGFSLTKIEGLVEMMNGHYLRGWKKMRQK